MRPLEANLDRSRGLSGIATMLAGALGIAGAVAASGVLSSVLFGVSPLDPLALSGAAAFVLGVALGAGVLAARRAAQVDPVVTLRHD